MSIQQVTKEYVIERTRYAFAKVPMRGGTLTVANHYRSKKFSKENDGWHPEIIEYSKDRAGALSAGLKSFGPRAPLEQVACALDAEPVLNDETRQMMAFDPQGIWLEVLTH